MSKASIETDLRDYGGFRNPEEIVFTNAEELSEYNKILLHNFITYINEKEKRTHNVYNCCGDIKITFSEESLIKEFNDFVMSKIIQ